MANEKILIVDDDLDTLKLVGVMLQRKGYRIAAASSGAKALAIVKDEKPDLILLDIMMPEMDGFEVARRLRADPETADIPILMFTAKSQVEDKLTGFDAGADDYLTKPAHAAELLARVKKLLRTSSRTAARSTAPASPKAWTVGVVGVKGGVGSSTVALSLGIMLQRESKKNVVMAELRPGEGTWGLELGHPSLGGLAQLLQQAPAQITRQAVEEALVNYSTGLRVLLASYNPGETALLTQVDAMEAIAKQVRFFGDIAVLDLGPSLQPATAKILPLCDEILLVTDGYPQTVVMAKEMVDYFLQHGVGTGRLNAVLVNRTRSDIQLGWMDIQKRLGIPVATVIPPVPEAAYRAQNSSKPIVVMRPQGMLAAQMGKLVRIYLAKI